jgi:hypothetical protein
MQRPLGYGVLDAGRVPPVTLVVRRNVMHLLLVPLQLDLKPTCMAWGSEGKCRGKQRNYKCMKSKSCTCK